MEKFDNLYKKIEETVEEAMVPGMVVGIIDGKNQSVRRFGETYPIYDLASVTKLFISTRILQLVEDGKFDLDTPIYEILPRFTNQDITIDHCLLHRSGFAPSMKGRYVMTTEELVDSMYKGEDIQNPVDTVMAYSCINFLVLGEVIVHFDGSIEAGLKQGVFEPLGLKHTGFHPSNPSLCAPTSLSEDNHPVQGVVNDRTALVWGGIAGNAGLFSDVEDLLKFSIGYLDQTILTHEMINLVLDTNVDSRSMGWNVYKDRYVFHTGYTGPSILLDIEEHKALVILTNRNFPKQNDAYLERRLELFDLFVNQ